MGRVGESEPGFWAYWWFRLRSFIGWYRRAQTRYDIHSPRLSDFMEQVWKDRPEPAVDGLVSDLRRYYQQLHLRIPVPQLGAGSRVSPRSERDLAGMVRHSSLSPRTGRRLARLARWTHARTIVELGTHAGISTAYLSLAQPRADVHTIEGNEYLARHTQAALNKQLHQNRIHLHTGTFAEQLPRLLNELDHIDLLFVDGDHRYQPTLDYVRACLPYARSNSVFVIADIHWSPGMQRAWTEICQWPAVTTCLSDYHLAYLFFDPALQHSQAKEIVGWGWKFWRAGVW